MVDLRSDLPHPVAQAVEGVSPRHVEDEEDAVSVAVELVTNISEHVQPGSVEDVNRNLREEVKLFCRCGVKMILNPYCFVGAC